MQLKLKERNLDKTILFANEYHRKQKMMAEAMIESETAISGEGEEEDEDNYSPLQEPKEEKEDGDDGSSDSSDDSSDSDSDSSSLSDGATDSSPTDHSSDDDKQPMLDKIPEQQTAAEYVAVIYNSSKWWRKQLGRAYGALVRWMSTNTYIICFLALVINHAGTRTLIARF